MFELFTKIRLNTENIHTFNMVHLVLGTTVNCLAVWVDSVLAQFCTILARFVQFLHFPLAKEMFAHGSPEINRFLRFSRFSYGFS